MLRNKHSQVMMWGRRSEGRWRKKVEDEESRCMLARKDSGEERRREMREWKRMKRGKRREDDGWRKRGVGKVRGGAMS